MATRKDIANRAGVSVSVVSRALNNSGYVDNDKKEKILKIAEELGYYPHPVAMSLQKRRTKQILFYCKDLQNSFNIEMYQGMMETAKDRGYMVVFNGSLDFNSIKETMIDGIIMPNENAAQWYLESSGKNYFLPVVTASYGNPVCFSKAAPRVEIDMYKATKIAVQYLRDNGHEKIALGMPYEYNSANARMYGYLEELRPVLKEDIKRYVLGIHKKDMGEDERLLRFIEEQTGNNFTVEESFYGKGEVAAQLFLERNLDATAILCFNDVFAFGVCNQFIRMGVRVPEDISIMGFDGTFARRYTSPLMTTVDLSAKKQGGKCAELLLDMLEGKKVKRVIHLPVKIMPGESVKNLHTGRSPK
ncbi:LacI family DNA-binding transcriptional regulator [Anaerocolumna sp. MB42-C2]|uniref:LacI family DNA-binding transcriptional regulator n=1 Tax=Anaerocolumna sp. MB42-C2 TaxID=3070997 RepID=UPI0027E0566E|nr:LacI family DNA-binding transcriptional regulator [Anaerocolumna sp. MB42-C2]WMJ87146.1 LacI family DNA-binding transcriptional regulator [Anaerocolumna sp. MB42-C2]